MIASGVFERFPGLKVILGHLGEGLPFWLYRLDFISTRRFMDIGHDHLEKLPSEYLRENFTFTTSGNFRAAPTQLVIEEYGLDHLMFASDYPYENMSHAAEFVESLKLSPDDASQLNSGTAEAVFGL
jgi:predicted TIM-barrel fold metal-dependent hydrolase